MRSAWSHARELCPVHSRVDREPAKREEERRLTPGPSVAGAERGESHVQQYTPTSNDRRPMWLCGTAVPRSESLRLRKRPGGDFESRERHTEGKRGGPMNAPHTAIDLRDSRHHATRVPAMMPAESTSRRFYS